MSTVVTEPIWKSWFARHGAKLLLFARQQARNPHDAEDLVQEAFVRIWRLYGHTGEVAPGLVYRAIRRLAIDWARSLDRRKIREQRYQMNFHFINRLPSVWRAMNGKKPFFVPLIVCLLSRKKFSP